MFIAESHNHRTIINRTMKMTFKEYLTEATIMSTDALKQAMRDYPQRQMGKQDGSKPKTKRLDQMDKRRKRMGGVRSEEEEVKRGRKKKPEFLKPQNWDPSIGEKKTRGRPKMPDMLKRQSGL